MSYPYLKAIVSGLVLLTGINAWSFNDIVNPRPSDTPWDHGQDLTVSGDTLKCGQVLLGKAITKFETTQDSIAIVPFPGSKNPQEKLILIFTPGKGVVMSDVWKKDKENLVLAAYSDHVYKFTKTKSETVSPELVTSKGTIFSAKNFRGYWDSRDVVRLENNYKMTFFHMKATDTYIPGAVFGFSQAEVRFSALMDSVLMQASALKENADFTEYYGPSEIAAMKGSRYHTFLRSHFMKDFSQGAGLDIVRMMDFLYRKQLGRVEKTKQFATVSAEAAKPILEKEQAVASRVAAVVNKLKALGISRLIFPYKFLDANTNTQRVADIVSACDSHMTGNTQMFVPALVAINSSGIVNSTLFFSAQKFNDRVSGIDQNEIFELAKLIGPTF